MLEEKIGVWWDINTCPVPKGIDLGSVRSRIEQAVTKYCGNYPVTIFCVGNLEHTAPQVLKRLSSSGIILRHIPRFGWSALCDHLREWKKRNRPKSRILLISGDISWFTGPWFISSILSLQYDIVRAFPAPRPPGYPSWREWVWEKFLLKAKNPNTNSQIPPTDEHASFCTLCEFPSQSCDDFIEHLQGRDHRDELAHSMLGFVNENNDLFMAMKLSDLPGDLFENMTRMTIPWTCVDLSQNVSCLSYRAINNRLLDQRSKIPLRGFSKTIGVWWDINTCPIPDGYDPGRVRACIESTLLGYIGHVCPVTIFCVGNLEFIPPQVLKKISSSGILLRHDIYRGLGVANLLFGWKKFVPPPAKIMLISADVTWFDYSFFTRGYTVLRALPDPQSFSSCTSTHAWAWGTLLEEKSCLVDAWTWILSPSERLLLKDTKNGPDLGFCRVCRIPSQSCDDFISHFKSTTHSQELWRSVRVDKNKKTRLFCKFCKYPGYDDHNMEIHLSSEEHAQKVKETKEKSRYRAKKGSDRRNRLTQGTSHVQ